MPPSLIATEPPGPAGLIPPARVIPAALLRYATLEALTPVQAEALSRVLKGRGNSVVAAPTGAGKTLVGQVALLQAAVVYERIGLYLAPTRALAVEQHDRWQRLGCPDVRLYAATGDPAAFDPADARDADVIITTLETFDLARRRRALDDLVPHLGLAVLGDVHLVGEGADGAIAETLITRLMLSFPSLRLLALSNARSNADALARWLNADLYASSWRPVRVDTTLEPYDEPVGKEDGKPDGAENGQQRDGRDNVAARLIAEAVADDGIVLAIGASRTSVETCAAAVFSAMRALHLPPPTGALHLHTGSLRVQDPWLRRVLAQGIAYYHPALSREDRRAVDRLVNAGAASVVLATPGFIDAVNRPIHAVVVRDVGNGDDEATRALLARIADRAGNLGIKADVACHIVTPRAGTERMRRLLHDGPLCSRLGDDTATYLNREIAGGTVSSYGEAHAWYERTLHRQVASSPADLGDAVASLLAHGFAAEKDGCLAPTLLGRAASDEGLSVAAATALERWLADRPGYAGDADALEHDLLRAVCALPSETRMATCPQAAAGALDALRAAHPDLREWDDERLSLLAALSHLLSGVSLDPLFGDGAAALGEGLIARVPRLLHFLARRANERVPGDPTVVVAASDLATCLQYRVAERGAGRLLEAIKWGYPTDESPREKVLRTYAGLRGLHVDTLDGALPHLLAAPRLLDGTQPREKLALSVRDGQLIAGLGTVRRPLRVHVRVRGQREITWGGAGADLTALPVAGIAALGAGGETPIVVEVATSGPLSPTICSYKTATATLSAPTPEALFARVDAILGEGLERHQGHGTGWEQSVDAPLCQELPDELLRRVVDAPPAYVRRASALLLDGVEYVPDRARLVTRLLRRRQRLCPGGRVRPFGVLAASRELSRSEGAILTAALLAASGAPVRLMRALLNGDHNLLTVWEHDGQYYGLPIWRTEFMAAPGGEKIAVWKDQKPAAPPAPAWGVLGAYAAITPRRLPLADVSEADCQ